MNSPYSLDIISKIKEEFKDNPDKCREEHKDICYYLDGLVGVNISQSVHPAGIVASPITLADNYGTMINDGEVVLQLNMDAAHEVGLIKYDLLGLRTIHVIEKAFQYINKAYPRAYEINWNDEEVWKDISDDNTGIFQFESNFSSQLLKQMHPNNIKDLSLVNACIRPSGESYRNKLTKREINYNADERVADLLSDSYGFLCIEENQLVNTQRGLVPIREVVQGDYVLTRKGWNKVLEARKTGVKDTVKIFYDKTSIQITLNHKVLTGRGWKEAKDISIGDTVAYRVNYNTDTSNHLLNTNIEWVKVQSIIRSGQANVYDLTVENEHEFTCQGIIVHNCYQEQQIKFMQQICGLTGSQADTVRRAIGEYLPPILEII